jgi:ribosomal protein S18 acetylase RimI-like enzyme
VPSPERATVDDVLTLAEQRREFWGERDLPALFHVLLVHEFGETALVVRDEEGGCVLAYAFALLTPSDTLYIHLLAVRAGHRGRGLARILYERLFEIASAHGARQARAFARPENAASHAFHTRMGFTAADTPDYAGRGQMRVVFTREIGVHETGMSN